MLLCLLGLIAFTLAPQAAVVAAPTQSNTISYWGMNLYLTKRERVNNGDNLPLLASMAKNAGVQWEREEFAWDLIEPTNNSFRTFNDASIKLAADSGLNITGVLFTTPKWARDGACLSNPVCPPANVHEYAQFAAWMAERYDGDGISDAPGSPRIAAWQIWNEPNDPPLWPNLGSDPNARRRRYGEMLVASYQAIKAADPTALVLTGGVYVYDGSWCHDMEGATCDGLRFMGDVVRLVPAARNAFDVLAIHPQIPTNRPDAPEIPRLITVEGRVRNSRGWLNANGRSGAPIWITEMGWCTEPGKCPGDAAPGYRPTSEDQQANYLTRSMVIAQHNGVQQTNWFQFEDSFNDPNREWANAAILRQYNGSSYPAKPAYYAYLTLATYLQKAIPAGTGPLNSHFYDPNQPYVGSGGTYDYRYTSGSTIIDVLWRPNDTVQGSFPVVAGKPVTLVDRDGGRTPLTPVNGVVPVTLSERPIMIVQGEATPRLVVSPPSITMLAQVGAPSASGTLAIDNGGLAQLYWSASTPTSWLSLSPNSGLAPGNVKITATTGGRSAGTYNGSITVTATNGAGTATVPVQLKIVSKLWRVYIPMSRR